MDMCGVENMFDVVFISWVLWEVAIGWSGKLNEEIPIVDECCITNQCVNSSSNCLLMREEGE